MHRHGYQKLIMWQKADELAFLIYKITNVFPKSELFGLTSQLRRAAVSVACNIAEGYGRQNKKELRHFLNIALGSLAEVDYLLSFVLRLQYISDSDYKNLEDLRREIGAMLWRFYKNL